MSRDTFIFIAFCVFALLVGMRLRQRISGWKKGKEEARVNKNQRSKMAQAGETPEMSERMQRRERRVRLFTIIQLVVLGGLMIYMIPALMRDFMLPGRVDAMNIFLRCLIFVFTIYVFCLGYVKVFKRKDKENAEK